MEKQINHVTDFHQQIGEVCRTHPELLLCEPEGDAILAQTLRRTIESFSRTDTPRSHLNRRALMAIEELAEWLEAHVEGDLVAAADAWADRMYVLLGDAVATGLPTEPLFDEVHRSNMTKAKSSRDSSKAQKLEQYTRPDIGGILNQAAESLANRK